MPAGFLDKTAMASGMLHFWGFHRHDAELLDFLPAQDDRLDRFANRPLGQEMMDGIDVGHGLVGQ